MTDKKNGNQQTKRKTQYCYDYPRPSVTVDVVLFHRDGERIAVLLIKRAHEPFKDHWAFPGGFVDRDESLDDAAARELQEETGLAGISVEQLGAFGDPGRDPRGHTVSIAFTALLEDRGNAIGADDAAEARWHSIKRLPRLAFDHKKILRLAIERVFGASQRRKK